MSILLEALRKSEKKQRPHETPTIHTEVQPGSSAGSPRVLPVSLLLVAALLLTGWFVWNQYRAPDGNHQQPVTLTADQVHKVPWPLAADRDAGGGTAKPSTPTVAPQERTPVESYVPPVQNEPGLEVANTPQPASQSNASSVKNNPAAATVKTPASADRKKVAAIPGGQPAAGANVAVARPPETTGKNAAATEEEFHPGEPEPIGYWELPDSIRADVPEIKFSVLVYDANPADRFVLVNGQRLGEGDSLKPGLEVKEIRRDGVVFSYRLYQFLVER